MKEEKKGEIIVIDEKPVQEKPQEEVKVKKEKVEFIKFNKILLYIFITILVMTVLLCLFQFTSASFSNFMWFNINNKMFDIIYSIMQNFPFLSSYGIIIIIIICLLILIGDVVVTFVYKENLKVRTIVENILFPILVVCGLFINFSIYNFLSMSSHRGINEIYMKDHINSLYTQEDLEKVIDYFKNRIIIYSESLNRNNGEIDVNVNPYDISVEDLKNLAIKYEFLNGSYPSKIHTLSEGELKRSGYPLGLTYNFSVGLDDLNLTDLQKIFTLSHELCHVKGVYRESDADYCAFIAGYNSNSDVSKYSMYLSVFPNLLNALKNEELYKNIRNELGTICIESSYNEICNLYFKDINRFIEDSDTLELYTYSLDVYKEYKEELKQYLLGLKNRFNVTIFDDDNKQLSLEDANALIDEESTSELYITGKITQEKYNENQKYLVTIADFFPNLYLSNSKEKEEDYSSFDYLSPYPSGSFISLTAKEPEFGYSRSVRSIIEYFDKYVLN